jgi:hypothetical protein
LCEQQNSYINQIKGGSTIPLREFKEDGEHMLAVTLSLVILNKFRNRELRKELQMATKGKVN